MPKDTYWFSYISKLFKLKEKELLSKYTDFLRDLEYLDGYITINTIYLDDFVINKCPIVDNSTTTEKYYRLYIKLKSHDLFIGAIYKKHLFINELRDADEQLRESINNEIKQWWTYFNMKYKNVENI